MESKGTRRQSRPIALAALLFAAAFVAALMNASPAAAVTVGTSPNQAPAFGAGCEVVLISNTLPAPPSCSMLDPATGQTPPGQWRVTSARVRTGPRPGPMRVTMIQALRSKSGAGGIICCTASAQGPVFTPPANSVTRVNLNLPAVNTTVVIDREQVEVIDYLGITLQNLAGSIAFTPAQPAATLFFAPAFSTGATRLGGSIPYSVVPMVSAELQSCARGSSSGASASSGASTAATPCLPLRFSVSPRVRLLRNGTVARIVARVPGRGTLRLGQAGNGTRLVSGTSQKAKKAGTFRLKAKLNARGKRVLKRRGRVRATISVRFKPKAGTASSKKLRVVFRR